MFIPNREELAWAAGFVDGEGCFTRSGVSKRLTINQIHPYVLQRFHRAVGGIGKVDGPWSHPSKGPNRKPIWVYSCSSLEHLQAVYAMLYEFLSPVKREQGRLVLTQAIKWAKTNRCNVNKTHCKRGHPLSGDNIYRLKDSTERRCKVCSRAHCKLYRERITFAKGEGKA